MKSNILIAQAGAVALLLSFALYLTAAPHQAGNSTSSLPKHSIATRQKAKGISNFAQVSPNLYRGAQPSITGIESLQEDGRQHRDRYARRPQQQREGSRKKAWHAVRFDPVALSLSQRPTVLPSS
jgi:hypothetical protein